MKKNTKIKIIESKYDINGIHLHYVNILIPNEQDYDNNPELQIINYPNHLFIQFAVESLPIVKYLGDPESRPLEDVMFWGSEFSDFMRLNERELEEDTKEW